MTDWNGGVEMVERPALVDVVPASEVGRLGLIVECMEAGDDAERRRVLAYLVDRYGQASGGGRRGR